MIDSHCHLADEAFAADLDAVAERARAAGLDAALCILAADEPDELARAAAVTRAWPAVRYGAAVHPHRAGAYAGRAGELGPIVAAAVDRVAAVAVGEIGLDYHYDFAPRDVQQEVFATQVALAVARGLPVVIHTRDAMADTLAIVQTSAPAPRGVVHCFTGTLDEARQVIDAGLYLSLSGITTFPKAGTLREVAAFVPDDRLLVETDAPFLAPVPYRSRRNEPAFVTETAAVVARARGTDVATLGARTTANFFELFGRTAAPAAR